MCTNYSAMKSIIRFVSLGLLLSLLSSCFKKKDEPFRVTYKVTGYADCSYFVTISYTDSTGNKAWVTTNDQHWSKTVSIPKGSHASLIAYPFRPRNRTEWDIKKEMNHYVSEFSFAAKIIAGDREVGGESSKIVSLVLLPES